jgi:UDP-N-acetylmuramate: L-alanyl-gamma-D-glutamyl-meso-diaminopimelate ligase
MVQLVVKSSGNLSMHIHLLGICGTFMSGLALLAKQKGHHVTGSDAQVYPPMSTQLEQQGIKLIEGYDSNQLEPNPDLVVIGNVMRRGNPCVEYVLDHQIPYTSGPQFLAEHILFEKHVLAISGTHGKTTTSSMLAWILEQAEQAPGFLIGGIPQNFGVSARATDSKYFVIEADEYDSAFFDKRSKFVHYQPRTLVINNLEFDHADIFQSLEDIQRQFHHLIRTVPQSGTLIYPKTKAIQAVIEQGCWSQTCLVADDAWHVTLPDGTGSKIEIVHQGERQGSLTWNLLGQHNAENALMAILAAHKVGVSIQQSCEALKSFQPPKRRLELLIEHKNIRVYDDFAHHPTAISLTLEAMQKSMSRGRLFAVFEPRSATMKRGVHQETLAASFQAADRCFLFQPAQLDWDLHQVMDQQKVAYEVFACTQALADSVITHAAADDVIVIMSNGSFDGLHDYLMKELRKL